MIKENQRILNYLHIVSDGALLFLSFPIGFWIRFHVFSGIATVPLRGYFLLAAVYTPAQLFTFAAFGLYQSFRKVRLRTELLRMWEAALLDMAVLQSLLFVSWGVHYSRLALAAAEAPVSKSSVSKMRSSRPVRRAYSASKSDLAVFRRLTAVSHAR